MKIIIIVLVCTCVCGVFAQQNFDTVQIKTLKLAQSVYMLEGSGGI